MCYLYNFWVFVYVSFSHIAYVISTCMLLHFWAISAKVYTYSIYRFVIYYCVIFCSHILLYKCDMLS